MSFSFIRESLRLFTGVALSLALLSSQASLAEDSLPDDATYERSLEELRKRPITFAIDCGGIRYVGLDCELDIRQPFFNQNKNIQRENRFDQATIRVKIWDESEGNYTRLHTEWSSTDELSVVDFKKNLRFLNEDRLSRSVILQKLLLEGVIGHLRILTSVNGEGVVTVTYAAGDEPPEEKKTKTYSGPFYLNFSVNGTSMKNGIGAVNGGGTPVGETSSFYGNASSTVNYSTKKLRLKLSAFGNKNQSSVPDGSGGKIKSGSEGLGASLLTVYSFGDANSLKPKRWNLVLVGSSETQPASNIRSINYVQPAVEFTLVPFRIDENREFRFQLGGAGSHLNLLTPNARGNTQEKYLTAFSRLYLYWLFDKNKASMQTNLYAKKNLKYSGHHAYGASLTFRYQLTHSISFNTSGSYDYSARSLTFPGNPDYSNPAQTQYLGGNAGGNFYLNAGIEITLMNTLLFNRDRRGSQ